MYLSTGTIFVSHNVWTYLRDGVTRTLICDKGMMVPSQYNHDNQWQVGDGIYISSTQSSEFFLTPIICIQSYPSPQECINSVDDNVVNSLAPWMHKRGIPVRNVLLLNNDDFRLTGVTFLVCIQTPHGADKSFYT